jgi:hypothetical protein
MPDTPPQSSFGRRLPPEGHALTDVLCAADADGGGIAASHEEQGKKRTFLASISCYNCRRHGWQRLSSERSRRMPASLAGHVPAGHPTRTSRGGIGETACGTRPRAERNGRYHQQPHAASTGGPAGKKRLQPGRDVPCRSEGSSVVGEPMLQLVARRRWLQSPPRQSSSRQFHLFWTSLAKASHHGRLAEGRWSSNGVTRR